jgi:hypothetical protein
MIAFLKTKQIDLLSNETLLIHGNTKQSLRHSMHSLILHKFY